MMKTTVCQVFCAFIFFSFCIFYNIINSYINRKVRSYPHLPEYGFNDVFQVKTHKDLIILKEKAMAMPIPPGLSKVDIHFSDAFKNPCWDVDTEIKCMPHVFLAGFAKSGTTDLYQKLTIHPDILEVPKEFMYFSRGRFLSFRIDIHRYGKIVTEFEPCKEKIDSYTGKYNDWVIINGDPAVAWDNRYIFHNRTTQGGADPDLLNFHYVKSVHPNAKILLTVRNPTHRMYSDYNYFNKKDANPSDFHMLVTEAIELFTNCMTDKDSSPLYCVYADIYKENKVFWRMRVGLYYVHILQMINAGFTLHDQIHIVRLEDYSENKIDKLNAMYKFINLTALPQEYFLQAEKVDIHESKNKNTKNVQPMMGMTKRMLDDFYRPYNEKLGELLGDPKYGYFD